MVKRSLRLDWEDVYTAYSASRYLALGSFFVLLAAFAWLAGGRFMETSPAIYLWIIFLVLTGLGSLLYLIGWILMRELARGKAAPDALIILSAAGLVIGVVPIFLSFPPLPWFLAFWILIPYVPSAFAPVLVAHAIIYLLSSTARLEGFRGLVSALASLYILLLAAVALWLQIFGGGQYILNTSWFAAMSGLASLGYACNAWSWWTEYHSKPTRRPGAAAATGLSEGTTKAADPEPDDAMKGDESG